MASPEAEVKYARGAMVRHRIMPAAQQAGVGRVMGVVRGFYADAARVWVVVQWPGGHVGATKPGNLELLKGSGDGEETPG